MSRFLAHFFSFLNLVPSLLRLTGFSTTLPTIPPVQPPASLSAYTRGLPSMAVSEFNSKCSKNPRQKLQDSLRSSLFSPRTSFYWSSKALEPAQTEGEGNWTPSLNGRSSREFGTLFGNSEGRTDIR